VSEGTCTCGRPLITRPGQIEPTCAECANKPGACGCEPLAQVSGAEVLDAVHAELTRYVVFPCPEAADAVTLYAAATHAAPHLEFAARLVIKSPVKRCGKSRLQDVLGPLVCRPLLTSDISAAALVRSISVNSPPTIMLDEADTTFGKALKNDEKAEHLRGILNAGFGRDRPYKRWDVTTRSVENCPTFAMAVLAGIGSLPDTIEDRAVIINMRRKTGAERVRKFRIRKDKRRVAETGERLAGWVAEIARQAGDAEPVMPPELDDRAEDVWEALIAVADLAGGDWPARARRAARVLTAARSADGTLPERLLADVRAVFGGADKMRTADILDALHKIDEAPWRDYYGRPLNARDLAALLRPFGVSSTDVKIDGESWKGYRREDLNEPWSRFLPPEAGGSATSATSATSQVSDVHEVAGRGSDPRPATGDPPLTRAVAEVAEVADPPGKTARCAVCGEPMDPKLAAAGYTTHPTCDPEEQPAGDDEPGDDYEIPDDELPF
jgi:hypothetical protein